MREKKGREEGYRKCIIYYRKSVKHLRSFHQDYTSKQILSTKSSKKFLSFACEKIFYTFQYFLQKMKPSNHSWV